MKTISVNEGASLSDALRDVERNEDVVVMRDGHVVALMTSFDDDDLAWYARERDPAFIASIKTARAQVAQGRTVGHDELKRRLGLT